MFLVQKFLSIGIFRTENFYWGFLVQKILTVVVLKQKYFTFGLYGTRKKVFRNSKSELKEFEVITYRPWLIVQIHTKKISPDQNTHDETFLKQTRVNKCLMQLLHKTVAMRKYWFNTNNKNRIIRYRKQVHVMSFHFVNLTKVTHIWHKVVLSYVR